MSMDQNKTDLVMKFVLEGKPVWAECALGVSPDDTLMWDFLKNTGYDRYSDFFEVSNFDMSLSLVGDDQGGSANGHTARQSPHQNNASATQPFGRWRSATNQEIRAGIPYPLDFDRFSFERVIDRASPIFFQSCCTSQTFDSAVLVKRLAQGDPSEDERPSMAYLRIEFKKVLITGINWDDGDVVKEKCDFICQSMKMTYLKQNMSGIVSRDKEYGAVWPRDRSLYIRTSGGRS
jgi:type VI protein secretion system component Hcp